MTLARTAAVICAVASSAGLIAAQSDGGRFSGSLDHRAIRYSTTTTTDAVAGLSRRMASGGATLTFEPEFGYLRSVLAALDVRSNRSFSSSRRRVFRVRSSAPRGRSLKDLDLTVRLLRYPCSYMIDTPAVRSPAARREAGGLPADVGHPVRRRPIHPLSPPVGVLQACHS